MTNRNHSITRKTYSIKILYFVAYIAFAAWMPYFYVYLKEFPHLSGFEIGAIAAVQQISSLFVIPIWGVWSDKFGRKKMTVIALLLSALLLSGFMIQSNFWFYWLFMLAFTLVYNPMPTLFDGLALEVEESSQSTSFGQMRLWASIGWASSSLVTGLLINTAHLSLIFPLASVLLLITAVLVIVLYQSSAVTTHQKKISFTHVWQQIISQPQLLKFLLLIFVYSIFAAPVMLILNMYYNELGASTAQTGAAFAVQSLCEIPFFFFGKNIVDRFGAKTCLMTSMLLTAVRLIGYGFASNPTVAIIIGSLHCFSWALFLISMVAFVQTLMPSEMRSSGQSVIYTAFSAGTCIGNIVTGLMHDVMSIQKTMILNAFAIIILVFAIFLIKNAKKIKAEQTISS